MTLEVPVQIPEAFAELWTPSRFKAYHGGRGAAKSQSFARALLIMAAEKPLRILCCREVQKSLKESVYQLLVDKINEMKLGDYYDVRANRIIGIDKPSAFIFEGLSGLTDDQIKSLEGVDIAWVEEAQTISHGSLEILRPTIRKPGSEIWFSWNPRHKSDPVDAMFRGLSPPARAIIREVNYYDNPFFTPELEEERELDKQQNPSRYGHVWLGHYEPVAIGALWDRLTLHENRVTKAPGLNRIVVAVDPATTSGPKSNDHGIVAVGRGDDGHGYVLKDASTSGKPSKWARTAIATFDELQADAVVIETNQGGDMCESTLRVERPNLPIIRVHASRGKHVRAEPISARYTQGTIHHVGTYPELEEQMCLITANGWEGDDDVSPDRLDALVWACTELFPPGADRSAAQAESLDQYAPVPGNSWAV